MIKKDLLILNYADADYNFGWSLSLGRIVNPAKHYMFLYTVKTQNTTVKPLI